MAPSATLFVDFDGTITARETFVAVLKRFAPERSAELIPRMLAEELTLREGVRAILESIPSDQYPAMLAHVADVPLREGLPELLDWLESRQVPFVLVSGGLEGIVRSLLGPLADRMAGIYAVQVDRSGPFLRPHSPYEGGTELLEKAQVIAAYPADEVIVVGDSLTDVQMSTIAHRVFARDRLQGYLDDRDIPYWSWDDFHDVRRILEEHWS